MNEDKLTHDERLRLECVAQAVIAVTATATVTRDTSPVAARVVVTARLLEDYIRGEASD